MDDATSSTVGVDSQSVADGSSGGVDSGGGGGGGGGGGSGDGTALQVADAVEQLPSTTPAAVAAAAGTARVQRFAATTSTMGVVIDGDEDQETAAPRISVRSIPGKGRGVFAEQDIPRGTAVERAPCIAFPPSQYVNYLKARCRRDACECNSSSSSRTSRLPQAHLHH